MKIKDILGICNARLVLGSENVILNNFSIDTRTINKNDTFIGIKGEVFDGNTFYEDALEKGAKTCILANIDISFDILNKYSDRNILIVDNTLDFLIEIAKLKRKLLNIPIIAVTGSVGKTSTKNIIADVLSTKYKVLKTEGNLNTNIGLSLTLLSLTDEDVVVLEMGMNQKGEISVLTNIAKPTVAVITNIGTSHIGNLGSRENILKAKLEILEGLQGPLIINNDSDLLNDWNNNANDKYNTITYGIDNISDYQAFNITYGKNGSNFIIKNENININVIGKHFIYNSLVALIIGDLFKIERNLIIKKLNNLQLEPHRMEIINNGYTIIDDTYNASYDSVYYALNVLNAFDGRKIAVLGDILELGIYGEEIHRNIGKLIKQNNIDLLITVGDLSEYINKEAVNSDFNLNNSRHFKSNREAIDFINNIKQDNDVILVKASHGMDFLNIVNNIYN